MIGEAYVILFIIYILYRYRSSFILAILVFLRIGVDFVFANIYIFFFGLYNNFVYRLLNMYFLTFLVTVLYRCIHNYM